MYAFEFSHTLSQQDLSDIWQNLPPDIGTTMEVSELAITHPLLQKELLGQGGEEGNQTIDMPERLKWMVFKVKQRAATNYFKKTVLRNPEVNTDVNDSNVTKDEFGDTSPIQYNWPYDFFSLVELVKIDAEVELGNIDFSDYTDTMPEWDGVSADREKIEFIVGGLEDNPIAEVQIPTAAGAGATGAAGAGVSTDLGLPEEEGDNPFAGMTMTVGNFSGLGPMPQRQAGPGKTTTLEQQAINNMKSEVTPSIDELRFQWLKIYKFEYGAVSYLSTKNRKIRVANRRTNDGIRAAYSYVSGIDSFVGLYGAPPGEGSLTLGGVPDGVN
jgi:hypothetical protein